MSSTSRGSKLSNSFDDSSRQGFVFASISQQCKSESTIKSSPNNSKQFLRRYGFTFLAIYINNTIKEIIKAYRLECYVSLIFNFGQNIFIKVYTPATIIVSFKPRSQILKTQLVTVFLLSIVRC